MSRPMLKFDSHFTLCNHESRRQDSVTCDTFYTLRLQETMSTKQHQIENLNVFFTVVKHYSFCRMFGLSRAFVVLVC